MRGKFVSFYAQFWAGPGYNAAADYGNPDADPEIITLKHHKLIPFFVKFCSGRVRVAYYGDLVD